MSAVAEATSDGETSQSLAETFLEAYKLHDKLQSTSVATSSQEFQNDVQKAIDLLEKATLMVNNVQMFSSNEEIEEVASSNLKFLLLPALLGSLFLKSMIQDRLEAVKIAELYFKDFLKRCHDYGATTIRVDPETTPNEGEKSTTEPRDGLADLTNMALRRQEKIARFREQKETDERLQKLGFILEKEEVDDEVLRDYSLLLLRKWINVSVEEISSIKMEKTILELRPKENEKPTKRPPGPPPKPLKPIIITRNQIQKEVFGMGYPNIPTMTIEEFYEEKAREGTLPMPGMGMNCLQEMAGDPNNMAAQRDEEEAEQKERQLETEDPDALRQARNWDDWKDDHRRGWGNRKNMG